MTSLFSGVASAAATVVGTSTGGNLLEMVRRAAAADNVTSEEPISPPADEPNGALDLRICKANESISMLNERSVLSDPPEALSSEAGPASAIQSRREGRRNSPYSKSRRFSTGTPPPTHLSHLYRARNEPGEMHPMYRSSPTDPRIAMSVSPVSSEATSTHSRRWYQIPEAASEVRASQALSGEPQYLAEHLRSPDPKLPNMIPSPESPNALASYHRNQDGSKPTISPPLREVVPRLAIPTAVPRNGGMTLLPQRPQPHAFRNYQVKEEPGSPTQSPSPPPPPPPPAPAPHLLHSARYDGPAVWQSRSPSPASIERIPNPSHNSNEHLVLQSPPSLPSSGLRHHHLKARAFAQERMRLLERRSPPHSPPPSMPPPGPAQSRSPPIRISPDEDASTRPSFLQLWKQTLVNQGHHPPPLHLGGHPAQAHHRPPPLSQLEKHRRRNSPESMVPTASVPRALDHRLMALEQGSQMACSEWLRNRSLSPPSPLAAPPSRRSLSPIHDIEREKAARDLLIRRSCEGLDALPNHHPLRSRADDDHPKLLNIRHHRPSHEAFLDSDYGARMSALLRRDRHSLSGLPIVSPAAGYRSPIEDPQSPEMIGSPSDPGGHKGKRGRPRKHAPKIPLPPLYVFIRNMLHNRAYNPTVISWVDESQGKFKVNNTVDFARTWGLMKSNRSEEMNYEKMSRAMRYHYGSEKQGRKGHLAMVKEKRLVYQFGELAINWRRSEVELSHCEIHDLCKGHLCLWSKE